MNETIKMIGTGAYHTVSMRAFNEGDFHFKPEAIIQVVSAAGYAKLLADKNEINLRGYENFNVLAKFVMPAMEISHGFGYKRAKPEEMPEGRPVLMHLTASELKTILVWVQAKHDHCQANKDKPEFNVESFYEMKDLILSIREVLLPQQPDNKVEYPKHVIIK